MRDRIRVGQLRKFVFDREEHGIEFRDDAGETIHPRFLVTNRVPKAPKDGLLRGRYVWGPDCRRVFSIRIEGATEVTYADESYLLEHSQLVERD